MNWYAGVIVLIELLLVYLSTRLDRIGYKRGTAISGWISLFPSIGMLISSGNIEYTQLSFYLLSFAGLVAMICVMLIFYSRDKPQVQLSDALRPLFKFVQVIGWALTIVLPIIVAFFG